MVVFAPFKLFDVKHWLTHTHAHTQIYLILVHNFEANIMWHNCSEHACSARLRKVVVIASCVSVCCFNTNYIHSHSHTTTTESSCIVEHIYFFVLFSPFHFCYCDLLKWKQTHFHMFYNFMFCSEYKEKSIHVCTSACFVPFPSTVCMM